MQALYSSGGAARSSCSDIREINEAKVANILSYLDDAAVSHHHPLSHYQLRSSDSPPGATTNSLPLTASALQQVTGSLPSSVAEDRSQQLPSAAASTAWLNCGLETAQHTYLGIKKKIEALQFVNDDLQRDNEQLRARLEEWLVHDQRRKEEARACVASELDELRRELSKNKKKAQEQTDKLTAERETLTHSVESLSTQLRREMTQREADRSRLESANAAAIASLKGKWQAQEKTAREKWKIVEAKRIKETTLQSLEPDIVLLLNRHKAEKARMREEYENELRSRDEAIAAKDASVEELKSRLQREAQATLMREQQCFQERLREETERVRRLLEEDRRSEFVKREQMEHSFEDQKRTLQREIDRLGKEVLRLQSAQTTEQAQFHEAVTTEVARITGQSNEMLSNLKDKLMLEFAQRERETFERNTEHLKQKEDELRRKCELERDTAITKVVQRLEEEHLKALTAARGSDGLLRERYAQLMRDRERLTVEVDLTREQLTMSQGATKKREEELERMRDVTELAEKRVQSIEDRIRSQYEAKLTILDNEWHKKLNEVEATHAKEMCATQQRIETIMREMEVLKSNHDVELKAIEQKHHVELSQINERVLIALTRKENTIQTQSDQLLALQEAIQVRDQELQRHRTLL